MATFKQLDPQDIKTTKSTLNQLIDIAGEDISGSSVNTRRKYVHWASSSYSYLAATAYATADITSSLWQTVYDQDYTVATANPLFDVIHGHGFGQADHGRFGCAVDKAIGSANNRGTGGGHIDNRAAPTFQHTR